MKTKIILVLSWVCMLMSCGKDNGTQSTFTLSGYLYKDCSKQPLANQAIDLYQQIIYDPFTHRESGGIFSIATTDNNGYFKMTYQLDNKTQNEMPLLIETAGKEPIIGIPLDSSLEDIVAYQTPFYNLQLTLNVINPHSAVDTLHITDFSGNSSGLAVIGPLTSGVLYTRVAIPLIGMSYTGVPSTITWWFNTYSGNYQEKDYLITKYCDDTTFVTVDIY